MSKSRQCHERWNRKEGNWVDDRRESCHKGIGKKNCSQYDGEGRDEIFGGVSDVNCQDFVTARIGRMWEELGNSGFR